MEEKVVEGLGFRWVFAPVTLGAETVRQTLPGEIRTAIESSKEGTAITRKGKLRLLLTYFPFIVCAAKSAQPLPGTVLPELTEGLDLLDIMSFDLFYQLAETAFATDKNYSQLNQLLAGATDANPEWDETKNKKEAASPKEQQATDNLDKAVDKVTTGAEGSKLSETEALALLKDAQVESDAAEQEAQKKID